MENTHSNLRKIIKKIIQESFQIEKQKQEFGIEILKKFSEHRKIKIHDISTNILTSDLDFSVFSKKGEVYSTAGKFNISFYYSDKFNHSWDVDLEGEIELFGKAISSGNVNYNEYPEIHYSFEIKLTDFYAYPSHPKEVKEKISIEFTGNVMEEFMREIPYDLYQRIVSSINNLLKIKVGH